MDWFVYSTTIMSARAHQIKNEVHYFILKEAHRIPEMKKRRSTHSSIKWTTLDLEKVREKERERWRKEATEKRRIRNVVAAQHSGLCLGFSLFIYIYVVDASNAHVHNQEHSIRMQSVMNNETEQVGVEASTTFHIVLLAT